MLFHEDEGLITEADLAKYLGRSRRQLQRDRATRQGVPFVMFGAQVRYRVGDVRRFVAQHLVSSAAELKDKSPLARSSAPQPRRRGQAHKDGSEHLIGVDHIACALDDGQR